MSTGLIQPYLHSMRASEEDVGKDYYISAKSAYSIGHYKVASDLARQAVYSTVNWEDAYILYYFASLRASVESEGADKRDYSNKAATSLKVLKDVCAAKGLSIADCFSNFYTNYPGTKEWYAEFNSKNSYVGYTIAALATIVTFWLVKKAITPR